jgi:hypothetical protein
MSAVSTIRAGWADAMVWAKQGVAKPETVREAAIRAAKAIGRMAGSLFTPSIM